MKALTVLQPFASLIVEGLKTMETRKWSTDFRGRLLIHAGKATSHIQLTPPGMKFDHLRGVILGSVELIDVEAAMECEPDEEERRFGFFHEGYFAWKLANPVKLDAPIPCRGDLGFWTPPTSVLEKLRPVTSCR